MENVDLVQFESGRRIKVQKTVFFWEDGRLFHFHWLNFVPINKKIAQFPTYFPLSICKLSFFSLKH